jgi:membrane peptidoglycan carboxypeptidase
MQLVKNVFLSHERAVERKFQELFLTYWLNRVVPKPRILEVYLNMIEWGKGINGLADAAKHYFNKTPHELTLAESVWISSISPAPLRRENQRQTGVPPWFREVVAYTIRGMGKRGRLSEAEVAQGLRQPIRFANQSGEGAAAGDVAAPSAEELAAALAQPPVGEREGGSDIVPEAEGSGTPVPLTEQEIKDAAAAARTAKFLADSPAARLSGMGASARAHRGAGARPVAAPPKRRR